MIPEHINITAVDNYPKNKSFKKLSKKNRKPCTETGRLGVLEHGHSAVAFIFPWSETLFDELEVWWEVNDALGTFPCELIPFSELGEIHVVFFEECPFFRGQEKHVEATSVAPDVFAQDYYKVLPENVTGRLKEVIVTDWDYGLDCWELEH